MARYGRLRSDLAITLTVSSWSGAITFSPVESRAMPAARIHEELLHSPPLCFF